MEKNPEEWMDINGTDDSDPRNWAPNHSAQGWLGTGRIGPGRISSGRVGIGPILRRINFLNIELLY